MKHRELIIAAMDGKTIQVRGGPSGEWHNWTCGNVFSHFGNYPSGFQTWEYRLKPEPVPDKVSFGVVCNSGVYPESIVRGWMEQRSSFGRLYTHLVKLTIKTDENGVETEHVEIVK